jgi:HlyD family secretion protein
VRTRIEQRGSTQLATGLPAEIFLRNQPDTALKGKVARVELIADSLTEERWVDVAFEQASTDDAGKIPNGLAIGMLANVTIHLPVIENAQWLPAAALQSHQRQSGVWLIRDNRAHFAAVKTGTRTLDGKIQILSGIDVSDEVISYTGKPLDEDQRLKVSNHD